MPYCSLPGCKSSTEKGQRVFKVPTNGEDSLVWIEFMQRNKIKKITPNSRVCELHFLWFQTSNEVTRAKYPTIDSLCSELQVKTLKILYKILKKLKIGTKC